MKALQVGKRYVNTTINDIPLDYTSSIADNRMNEIGTLATGDVCVLLEIVQLSCYSNSIDLKVLAPNGTIGWIWTCWSNAGSMLRLVENDQ
jgi:hypothetical protein